MVTTPRVQAAPFVGPRQFESSEEGIFFGRDSEVDELYNRILAYPCTLLYSRSGLGKSSLVEAGLRPRLAAQGWQALPRARVVGRTGASSAEAPTNPFIWNVIESWSPNTDLGKREDSLTRTLSEFHGTEPGVVAILEQFEEFFTEAGTSREREDFLGQVREGLVHCPSLRVLIVMREEFIADLDAYKHLLPGAVSNRMRLGRLGRGAAAVALRKPLERVGVTIDEEAMTALLNSLTCEQVRSRSGELVVVSSDYAEPVHLQIVARELWDSMPSGAREVTLGHVKGLESKDPLGAFYQSCVDEAARQSGSRVSEILRWCATELITPAETRAIVYRGEEQTNGMSNKVVDILQEEHLIRAELRAGAQWIELAHDQFVRPVLAAKADWEARMAEPLQMSRSLEKRAAEWASTARWSNNWLEPNAVKEAERWLRDFAPEIGVSQEVRDYIAWCQTRNERIQSETRRLYWQRFLLIVGCIAALTVAWWSWTQSREKIQAVKKEQATQRALVEAIERVRGFERARDATQNTVERARQIGVAREPVEKK